MTTEIHLPQFSSLQPEHIPSQLEDLIVHQKNTMDELLKDNHHYTWDNLIAPLEQLDITLGQFWSPISHCHNVCDTPKLREAYNQCLPMLSEFSTWAGHHQGLYKAIQSLKASEAFSTLSPAQQKVITNHVRDFELAGINLNDKDKERYAYLCEELSLLSNQFAQNVLDSSQSWTHHVTDPATLEGIPDTIQEMAANKAKDSQQEGWILTLDAPCYLAIMQHATSPALRETFYRAYATRASDQSPHDPQWDNTDVMHQIMSYRQELAHLLGFNDYAEFSLATKMLDKPEQVFDFIHQLSDASLPKAKQEYKALQDFAKDTLGLNTLEPWDITYASEQQRKDLFDISDEQTRPYFPLPQVLRGLFHIAQRLFHITIQPKAEFDSWHADAQCFEVYNADKELISVFYLDLFAREGKRNGAWMDDSQGRHRHTNQKLQCPIAYIACNFNGPSNPNTPALLTHNDVVTLFHEFGHATQHMLTQMDIASISGINGIPWDAVEIASQLLENWAWDAEAVQQLASHYQDQSPLPQALLDNMIAAKNFQSGLAMMRQLEFSLFDFSLHTHFDPTQKNSVRHILKSTRDQVAVYPTPTFHRFENGFSHIFAGGYDAGYYSYKWAEVMAADVFNAFKETDIFDEATSKRYQDTFLALGGAYEPMDIFIKFRGRKPQIDALLDASHIH